MADVLLQQARHAVALTGAGFPTPSGIPDFHSAGYGLWNSVDPMELASLWAFRYDPEAFYQQTRTVPKCAACGGYLKPAVVLFGEQLPYQVVAEAEALCDEADMLLIAGSSPEVAPASELPLISLRHGARLIIVNQEPTYLDASADVVIRHDVGEVFPLVLSEVMCDE